MLVLHHSKVTNNVTHGTILEGNWKKGPHEWSTLKHLFRSKVVSNFNFIFEKPVFLHTCSTYSELPSHISAMNAISNQLDIFVKIQLRHSMKNVSFNHISLIPTFFLSLSKYNYLSHFLFPNLILSLSGSLSLYLSLSSLSCCLYISFQAKYGTRSILQIPTTLIFLKSGSNNK